MHRSRFRCLPFSGFALALASACVLNVAAANVAGVNEKKPAPSPAANPVVTGPSAEEAVPQVDLDAVVREIETLALRGEYEQIIKTATPILAKSPKPDSRLLYRRAWAAWHIGALAQAAQDFSRVGDFKPHEESLSASDYIEKIETLKAIMPSYTHEVRRGKGVVLSIHYSQDDAWTTAVAGFVLTAYAINKGLLKKEYPGTKIFLLDRAADFRTFYEIYNDAPPPASSWIGSQPRLLYLGRSVDGANHGNWRSAIVYHLNQAMVRRAAGEATMPFWFSEGLAEVAKSQFSEDVTWNLEQRMRRALLVKAFAPLGQLSDKQWNPVNASLVPDETQNFTDPVAQSYFMTSYLLSLMPPDGLPKFFADLKLERSFDAVLEKHTSLAPDKFYAQWLEWLPQKLEGE